MTTPLKEKLKSLPSSPGVYFHKSATGEIIYVGKAAVLKNRVRSYFQNTEKDRKTAALVSEITDTDWTVTETEMDALFLESEMVKRYKPKWNILLRDDKNVIYVRIDMKSEVPSVTFTRNPLDDGATYLGPYYGKYIIATALRILRKIFPYYDKPYTGKKTLNTDLRLTPGIEIGATTPAAYKSDLRKLISYIKGNRTKVIKDLERDMKAASRAENYEEAATLRNQYLALRGLATKIVFSDKEFLALSSDAALTELQKTLNLPKPPHRIEGFDISHQSGTNVVASMVTFINGVSDRRLYRKFKIRSEKNDDFANMREVITRRLNHLSDWGTPDLILIDGGEPQLRAVHDLIEAANIPYIGLAKEFETIVVPSSVIEKTGGPERAILGGDREGAPIEDLSEMGRDTVGEVQNTPTTSQFSNIRLPRNSHTIKLLQRIRDESHRFAITYHTLLKTKRMLK